MDTDDGLWKPLMQLFRLANALTLAHLSKALNDSMFGHMARPFHAVDDVAVLIGNGGCTPIIPQPHGVSVKADDFDPCPENARTRTRRFLRI